MSLERFSRAIALIHEAGAAPERWTDALAAIVGLIEGERAALMDIDAQSGALLGIEHIGHDPANAKTYSEYYYAIDPTRASALAAPVLKATTTYESFPDSLRARHEYFDFARRIDIGDVIGTSTPQAGGRRSLFSLQRSVNARAYGADEKALFEMLASHLALAKRVQARLGEIGSSSVRLEALLGKLTGAAFIADGDGRVRHLNAPATALAARQAGLSVRGGRLVLADAKRDAALQAALRNAARSGGRSAALLATLGGEAGEILVTPLQASHGLARDWEIPLALIMVSTGPRDEKAIAWRMRELYRLTAAESRIAAELALGRSIGEIARSRHVSEATLRTHLRSIFGKTGARRQAELVRLALRGAALDPES